VGRIPNTNGIGLQQPGIELNSKGFVKVNERLKPPPQMSGRWEIARAVRFSPRLLSTISALSLTI
jgi:hypothetical protein